MLDGIAQFGFCQYELNQVGLNRLSMLGLTIHSLRDLFSRELRGIFWRSVGLTTLIMILAGGALIALIDWTLTATTRHGSFSWVEPYLGILSGIGVFIGGLYLLPSISMLVAGFFLEDIASVIEKRIGSHMKIGQSMTVFSAMLEGIKFFGLTLAANACALVTLFVPGINFLIYFTINSVLFGREYFFIVTGRHQSRGSIIRLYRLFRNRIWFAGLIISAFAVIPLINLLTPLFATILMVRLYREIDLLEQSRCG